MDGGGWVRVDRSGWESVGVDVSTWTWKWVGVDGSK